MQANSAYNNFIDEYVDKARQIRTAFTTDTTEVHTYIFMFASGNKVTEAKIVADSAKNNGRLDFIAVEYHYEGIGVQEVNVLQAHKVLNYLFYSGEKKPHI